MIPVPVVGNVEYVEARVANREFVLYAILSTCTARIQHAK